jgi:hypothetical protein
MEPAVRLSIVLQSHLSDTQWETGKPKVVKERVEFCKYLIHRYNDLSTEIYPQSEFEEFKKHFQRGH